MRNAIWCGSAQGEASDEYTPTIEAKVEAGASPSVRIKQMGSCMICGSGLDRREDVVWCRHCGRLAHRIHLMEWMQTRKSCPSCGGNLDEKYFR